jgi:arsenate reductase-like glutaredoxin family protein
MAIAIASVFAIVSTGCKHSGKYGDLKEYMNDVRETYEGYISDLEKSNSAKEVAEAITEFGDNMEKLVKRGEELEKRYPDWKVKYKENPPKELKEEFEKHDQMIQRYLTVSMKMMKYMMDPEVMKASQEMAKKMGRSSLMK